MWFTPRKMHLANEKTIVRFCWWCVGVMVANVEISVRGIGNWERVWVESRTMGGKKCCDEKTDVVLFLSLERSKTKP